MGAVVATAVQQNVFRTELGLEPTYLWGFSGSGLLAGHWSTLLTSQFLTRDVFMALSIPVSLAVMLGVYEILAGTVRATIVAVASAAAGPGLVTAALGLGSALNVEFAARTLETIDYGASAMTAGGGGALVAIVRNRWLTLAAVVFVLSGLVVHHEMADWEHLSAFPVGFGLGWLMDRWHPIRDRNRSRSPGRTPRLSARTASAAVVLVAIAIGGAAASSSFAAPSPAAAMGPASGSEGPVSMGSSAPPGPVSPARLLDVRYPTPALGGDRRVLVLLPAGYDSSSMRYPVVEMLHGRPGGPDDIFTGMGLLSIAPTVTPFIAVVPDGHGPVVADGDFADTSKQHLGAALGEDLQHWVDTTYRTNGHWAAMGLSSGGFGAAYLATRPASHYDAVCSLGGNFVAQDPPFAGEAQAVRDAASPLLHVSATGPRTLVVAARNDADGVNEAQRYAAALTAVGQAHDLVLVEGGHDWDFFRAETPRCLRYVLAGAS
jgi:enterochelin esterase-like enzyme